MATLTKQRSAPARHTTRTAQTVRLEDLERALDTEKIGAAVVISRTDRRCRYTYISSTVERITGLPVAAFLGRSQPIAGVDIRAAAQLAEARAAVHLSLQPSQLEIAYPGIDGLRYYRTALLPEYDDEGRIESILTVSRDITSERVHRSRSVCLQLDMALDLAGLAVWDWDLAEDMNHWSPRFAKILGLGTADKWHLIEEWTDRIHPDDRQSVAECLQDAVRHQQPFESEYRILVPGHGVRRLQARGQVTRQDINASARFIGVIRDVTDGSEANRLQGSKERELVPAFTLLGRILAWRCNVCNRLYVNTPESAECTALPSRWTGEFLRHLCAANTHNQDVP